MTAARQQRGQELIKLTVRLPAELHDWLRHYAAAQDPPISQALALQEAVEVLKATRSG